MHVGLKFLEKNDQYVIWDKSVFWESAHMFQASKVYEEAMEKVGMKWGDNFLKEIVI